MQTAKLIWSSFLLKVDSGGSHGLCTINKDEVNADLIDLLKRQGRMALRVQVIQTKRKLSC